MSFSELFARAVVEVIGSTLDSKGNKIFMKDVVCGNRSIHFQTSSKFKRLSFLVCFRTHLGTFLCADALKGGSPLHGNRSKNLEWETFSLVHLGKNKVAIATWHVPYVVCAEANHLTFANRTNIGDWETWEIEQHGKRYAFRSFHGRYLSCRMPDPDPYKNCRCPANSKKVGKYELFEAVAPRKSVVREFWRRSQGIVPADKLVLDLNCGFNLDL